MTEDEFTCIRALANYARLENATKNRVLSAMRADGWTDDQIKAAIAALREPEEKGK